MNYKQLIFLTIKMFLNGSYERYEKAYVFYVDGNINGFDGFAIFNLIWIDKRKSRDRGLFFHELTHVRQFYRDGLKIISSLWNEEYNLELELEACRAQISHGAKPHHVAKHLSSGKYRFKISYQKAFQLLTS